MLSVGAHTANSNFILIVAAIIAAIPGLIAAAYTWRKRRDLRAATATEFGTQMAQTAFKNMESQVKRLTDEQGRWDKEREEWDRDKRTLVDRISALTDQLHVTNQYLQMLLSTLDVHGIPYPAAPPGFPSE